MFDSTVLTSQDFKCSAKLRARITAKHHCIVFVYLKILRRAATKAIVWVRVGKYIYGVDDYKREVQQTALHEQIVYGKKSRIVLCLVLQNLGCIESVESAVSFVSSGKKRLACGSFLGWNCAVYETFWVRWCCGRVPEHIWRPWSFSDDASYS